MEVRGAFESVERIRQIPVRQIEGRTYVMAMRIVDLNAMLNVNVAGWPETFSNQRTGWTPVDMNLGELCARQERVPTFPAAGNWQDELDNLLVLPLLPLVRCIAYC